MLKGWGVAFLFLILLTGCRRADTAQSLSLPATGKDDFKFSQIEQNKASVFIFLSPECPLCENYTPSLNSLVSVFSPDSIAFYAVFAGNYYTKEEIETFSREQRLAMPCLLDREHKLTRLLDAGITPQAVVVNRSGTIIYTGRIDNRAFAPGRRRSVITEHDLKNAFLDIRNNRPVKIKKTRAIGCIIE